MTPDMAGAQKRRFAMKRFYVMSLIFFLAAVPICMAQGASTISFDFDIDQYVPVGNETEEELEEKAVQYNLHYYTELGINNPVWSPDGSKIAFTDNYGYAIHMVSPDGSGFVTVDDEIIRSHQHNWYEFIDGTRPSIAEPSFLKMKQDKAYLAFSPDGKEIAYSVTLFDESRGSYENGGTVGNFIYAIESIDIATGEIRVLVDGGLSPAWSLDGRYLAYINFDYRIYTDPTQTEYNGALAILDTQTGDVRYPIEYNSPERPDSFGFKTPSFSPDGSEIAFIYDRQLCTIPFEGGDITYLTDIDNDDLQWFGMSEPQYSPDGRWILFGYGWHNFRGMMVYDTTDGKLHMVDDGKLVKEFSSFDGPDSQFQGTWSPDGTRISAIFASRDVPVGSKINDIVWELSVVDFDPGAIIAAKISLESVDQIDLAFGEKLDVRVNPEDAAQYLPNTSIVPNLPLSEVYRWKEPQWSPDDKLIAFSGLNSLNIVSSDGGDATCIAQNYYGDLSGNELFGQQGFNDISFSPDGRSILYSADIYKEELGSKIEKDTVLNPTPIIEQVDIFTGETETLIAEGSQPSYSPDGRYIAYIHFDHRIYTDPDNADHNNIPAIFDTVTGETRFLADGNTDDYYRKNLDGYRHPTFSNDGSHVLLVNNRQICTIPFEGGELEYLTDFENFDDIAYGRPKYNNDGQWILFNRYSTDSDDLLMYNVSSGKTFWMFDGSQYVPGEDSPYEFSFVNGDKIFADCGEAYYASIPAMDGFVHSSIGSQYTPSFSPDGTKVLYVLTQPALQHDDMRIKTWLKQNHNPEVYETETNAWVCGSLFYIADFNSQLYDTTNPISVETVAPAGFALKGNFPNPFNPSTTIEFSIPDRGLTTVEIFNMAGQKVRDIISAELSAGTHHAVWDGCDDSGNTVSSGIYFARLKAGNFVTAKQMMMMK